MALPALPKKSGVEFRHLTEWPGYAIGDDGSVWEYSRKRWEQLKPTWHGRHRAVSLSGHGSFAKCRVADLYEEMFDGATLPTLPDRKDSTARPR